MREEPTQDRREERRKAAQDFLDSFRQLFPECPEAVLLYSVEAGAKKIAANTTTSGSALGCSALLRLCALEAEAFEEGYLDSCRSAPLSEEEDEDSSSSEAF